MRVFQTTAVTTPDGDLLVPMPNGLASGKHKVVVILEEVPGAAPMKEVESGDDLPLPVYDLGTWQNGTTLSREEMYDDWER